MSKNEKRGGASGARFYPDQERWLAWCRDRIFVPKSAALRAAVRLLQLYVPEGSDERRASSIIRALASDECDDAELVVWAAGLAKTLHEVSAEKDRRPPRPGGGKTDGSVGD